MAYSMKSLDTAITRVLGAEVTQALKISSIPMPSRLNLAVSNLFIYPDRCPPEVHEVIREAARDLTEKGQFNYAED